MSLSLQAIAEALIDANHYPIRNLHKINAQTYYMIKGRAHSKLELRSIQTTLRIVDLINLQTVRADLADHSASSNGFDRKPRPYKIFAITALSLALAQRPIT